MGQSKRNKDQNKTKLHGPDGQYCGTCIFGLWDAMLPPESVFCRRFPPTPISNPMTQQVLSHFPAMKASGWCGEWQSKVVN